MNIYDKIKNPLLFLLSFLSLTGLILINSNVITYPNAGQCSGPGTGGFNNNVVSINRSNVPLPEVGNRKYTVQELFGSGGSAYAVVHGHREKSKWGITPANKFSESSGITVSQEAQERLDKRGEDWVGCHFYGIQPGIQSISKNIADMITGFIVTITGMYFNPNLLCENAIDTSGCQVNLLKIAGGTGSGDTGGIMGSLGRGVFTPFAVLAFVLVGVWMTYTGLIKKQFRASLSGLLWAFLSFAMGIFVITQPHVFAKAPQRINGAISNCILEAFNGGNCMSTGSSVSRDPKNALCSSFAGTASRDDQKQLSLSSLTCNIYKGFSLDRWSEQMFGYSFDELYTMDSPHSNIPNYTSPSGQPLPGGPAAYCVHLQSNEPPSRIRATTTFNGQQVCNIALAYMANRTAGNYGNTATMEHIVAVAAEDPVMWGAMTGEGRDITGSAVFISIMAAAISFIPLAIYGFAYSLTASLLIIFAPIFLLIGIHPGRGKRIFLGYLESLVSAHLKFMATGLMLIVMISIYGAVISGTSAFVGMILSIIFAFTFVLYRKEIVNLIGATNMGGVKVSNQAEKIIDKIGDKTQRAATTTIGSGVGGLLAAGEGESKLGGFAKGVGKGWSAELKRGRGFIANTARAKDRVQQDYKKERTEKDKQIKEDAFRANMINEMSKGTDRTGAQLSKNANENLKSSYIAGLESKEGNITNEALMTINKNAKDKLLESKTKEEITVNGNMTSKIMAESILLQTAINKGSDIGQDTIKHYANDYSNMMKFQVDQEAEKLKNSELLADLSDDDKSKVIEEFKQNGYKEIESTIDELKKSIHHRKDNNGIERFVGADMDEIIKQKELLESRIKNLPIPDLPTDPNDRKTTPNESGPTVTETKGNVGEYKRQTHNHENTNNGSDNHTRNEFKQNPRDLISRDDLDKEEFDYQPNRTSSREYKLPNMDSVRPEFKHSTNSNDVVETETIKREIIEEPKENPINPSQPIDSESIIHPVPQNVVTPNNYTGLPKIDETIKQHTVMSDVPTKSEIKSHTTQSKQTEHILEQTVTQTNHYSVDGKGVGSEVIKGPKDIQRELRSEFNEFDTPLPPQNPGVTINRENTMHTTKMPDLNSVQKSNEISKSPFNSTGKPRDNIMTDLNKNFNNGLKENPKDLLKDKLE